MNPISVNGSTGARMHGQIICSRLFFHDLHNIVDLFLGFVFGDIEAQKFFPLRVGLEEELFPEENQNVAQYKSKCSSLQKPKQMRSPHRGAEY